MSRAVVVVQARAGSTRLPGKVLAELGGRPMLGLLLDRLAPVADAGLELVLATSVRDADDAVASLARERGRPVVRGSESDVLGRFALALRSHPAEHVVRITADCPMLPPDLVLAAVDHHVRTGADYTSNTLARTYPDGLDVEVLTAAALVAADREATAPGEREHVTPFVYRRPRRHRIEQLTDDRFRGEERWTVDTAADLESLRATVGDLGDPVTATYTDLLTRLPLGGASRPVEARPDRTVVHVAGAPFVRRWDLLVGSAPSADRVGTAEVVVDAGGGRLTLDVPPEHRVAAEAAVRGRLAADLQVVDLTIGPDGPTGAPRTRHRNPLAPTTPPTGEPHADH